MRTHVVRNGYGPLLILCVFSGIVWSLVIGAAAFPVFFLVRAHSATVHTSQQLALDP